MPSPLPLLLVAGVAAWALTRSSGSAPAPEREGGPKEKAAPEPERKAAPEPEAASEPEAAPIEAPPAVPSSADVGVTETPRPMFDPSRGSLAPTLGAFLSRASDALEGGTTGKPLDGSSGSSSSVTLPASCFALLDAVAGQTFRFVPILLGKRIDAYVQAYLSTPSQWPTVAVNLAAEYGGRAAAGSVGSASKAIGDLADCLRAAKP